MKKVLIIILIVIAVIAAVLCGIYGYYGGFSTVEFKVAEQKEEIFVYEDVIGDYSQSPIYMDSVYYGLLNDFKIETTRGAGIYYDNPEQVEKSKLRSQLGCLLDNPVDSAQMVAISSRFKVKTIPQGSYIISEFPHKGMMSVMVGIMKVYPAMNEYIEVNGYSADSPVIEIYDTPKQVIIYKKATEKK